jgi:hypothetical protein
MAHARRKLFELHTNHSSLIAAEGLKFFELLYDVERDAKSLSATDRKKIRQKKAKPVADALHQWLLLQRSKVPNGSATAKALDYSLKRWVALTHYLEDSQVPIDNNWCENQIRPAALGRNNANDSLMRTRLRRRAIPPSVEAPTASRLLRMITATSGTASTPWAGGSELA